MDRPLKLADACQLTDQLWVGGELDPADSKQAHRQLDELIAHGIDTIIDARIERDDIDWVTDSKPQIDYLWIGVEDAGFLMPPSWFDEGTEYALEQMHHGHVVLAHCRLGVNRGPSMAFAILLSQGWDPIDALDLIHTRRPLARIAYAEDAMLWRAGQPGNSDGYVVLQLERIAAWRDAHDVAHRRAI